MAAYIVAATRTAGAKRAGALSGWHPVDMGAAVLNQLVAKTGIDPAMVDDVIMGCVGQAGEQAANVARNAVLASNLPESVPGTSVDRQCGSSQQAMHFAAQAVMSGTMDVVIASGVESMTRVPMGMPMVLPRKSGLGYYMSDKLLASYGVEFSQFMGAEMMAKKYAISKEEMDEYSLLSHQRAVASSQDGFFKDEILALEKRTFNPKTGVVENFSDVLHSVDEGMRAGGTMEDMQKVKAILPDGIISAANASQICDGASGVMIVNEKGLKLLGTSVTPVARIHHLSMSGGDPVIMLEAPLQATERALARAGMSINDIDAFEVNEAFAPVPLAWLKHTGADPAKMNAFGGAIALGHPLGASGTKLMSTLVHGLIRDKKKYGLQTMCEGGGMANVTIIENLML
jgi:acetyl-CoA C-acetyltransferase